MMPAEARRAPSPPAALVLTTPEHLLAFGLGAGLSPIGPGTVGTLWGLPLFLLLAPLPPLYYAGAVALLAAAGIWICGASARLLGVHDAPGIVFDEIVGFLVTAGALLAVPATGPLAAWLAAAFVLFRLFDILKPWPIRWLDRHVHGGFGIMLDDLLAGVFAGALLVALRLLAGP